MKNTLKIIALQNIKEVALKINNELAKKSNNQENHLVSITESRFSNGEGKIKINESIRNQDLYILSDVGNYGLTFKMHGREREMSPDEHFQDIKRVISATSGKAREVTLIMPLLYQSRQHKRKGRESLDCAIALQELEAIGVNRIVTFDAHDPNVSNAVPNLPFDNFYPTHNILSSLIDQEEIKDLLVVSPDMGAMERSRYYADMLGCDVGVFYKRRDLSKVVNGKNPIVEHAYMGASVVNKNILIVDDMIASGSSMLEVAVELKKRGAKHIYFASTFALFTEGVDAFMQAYDQGYFDKLYSTNLSYVPEDIKNQVWYHEVDLSKTMADIIYALHNEESLQPFYNGKKAILEKIKNKEINR